MSGVKQQDAIEKEGPAIPLHAAVSALEATEGDMSVFEAKKGVRACHTVPTADAYDVCEELSRNNVLKKVVKTCKASKKQTGRNWTHSAVSHNDPKSKVLHKVMKKGLDPQFLNKHLLPDEPWAHKVYELDVVLTSKSYANIAATHYGSIEGRLYLEGHDTVVGLPIDKVEGSTWEDKRQTLSLMSVDEINKVVKDTGGFVLKCSEKSIVLLPSGFLILSASVDACYIRYPVSGDSMDTQRVVSTLETLVSQCPECRDPRSCYPQFLSSLKDISD